MNNYDNEKSYNTMRNKRLELDQNLYNRNFNNKDNNLQESKKKEFDEKFKNLQLQRTMDIHNFTSKNPNKLFLDRMMPKVRSSMKFEKKKKYDIFLRNFEDDDNKFDIKKFKNNEINKQENDINLKKNTRIENLKNANTNTNTNTNMQYKILEINSLEKLSKIITNKEFEDNLIIIYFWAKWCKPCMKLKPEFYKLSNEYQNIIFLSIDVDDNDNIANMYSCSGIPYHVFIKNKQIVANQTGLFIEEIKEIIEKFK